jgi:F-type H+-transporting ATPase subunit delta
MPRNSEAARRYARALYQLSESGDHGSRPQQVVQELRAFEQAFTKTAEVRVFLESPIVQVAEKREALQALEPSLPAATRFLIVLMEAGRISLIKEVRREFELLMEHASGEVSVTLETARSFSERGIEEIKRLLESEWNKKVKIEPVVNPELIGGFVASSAGKSLNASALGQLELLSEKLASV